MSCGRSGGDGWIFSEILEGSIAGSLDLFCEARETFLWCLTLIERGTPVHGRFGFF